MKIFSTSAYEKEEQGSRSHNQKNLEVYQYRDESGALLFEVTSKKNGTKAARRPDPDKTGEFIWDLKETRRVLYRLNEFSKTHVSEIVFFAADEKQADVLSAQGLFATTNVFGPGDWDGGYGRQLSARQVVIIASRDPKMRDHAERVALELNNHVESLKLLELTDGLQAFLAQGRTATDLLNLVAELALWQPSPSSAIRVDPYESVSAGMFFHKPTANGVVRTRLTNFQAIITNQIEIHDGSDETARHFEISATLKGRKTEFSVSAADFGAMNWVHRYLGAEAIIYPGNSVKDHARTAIQTLSESMPTNRRYTHLGWAKIDGQWVFLHAGGAVGAAKVRGPEGPAGPRINSTPDLGSAEIHLPQSLHKYVLPEPPTGERLRKAVQASLELAELAPRRITIPILAAVYRSVLGQADFSVYVVGPTGVRKTEVASRGQQHFGPELDSRNLPGSWSSTANALEACAFLCKDALFTIDDFCPRGAPNDIERINAQADRIFRGQGNNAGRQRLRSDSAFAPTRYPRGLVLSTGEVVPTGQSLRGRLVILDVGPGDVDLERLTLCQQNGQEGLYAQALAAYIQWLAPQYEDVRDRLTAAIPPLRSQFLADGQHPRSPENLAHLAYGYDQFLAFAESAALITNAERQRLLAEAYSALRETDTRQNEYQLTSEPTQLFIDALRAAFRAGRAHLLCDDMTIDKDPEVWGWVGSCKIALEARGEWIGWFQGSDVYLQPERAFAIAQQMSKELGEPLGVAQQTLQKRFRQRGVLKSWDTRRDRNVTRKTINGERRVVLHLDASLFQDTAPSAQPDRSTTEERTDAA